MTIAVHLNANAQPNEPGYCRWRQWTVMCNGQEVSRCVRVYALFGFGMAVYIKEDDSDIIVRNGLLVEAFKVGRIKAIPT